MITVVTELRFTIVPRHVGGAEGRFYFSAFITPTVTVLGPNPLPVIKVEDVAHLWKWPTTLSLLFGSFPAIIPPPVPPGNPPQKLFEIRLGQPGHLLSVPFEIDHSWRSKLQHADDFNQNRTLVLWQEIMKRAWIAPEDAGAGATASRTNIAPVDADIVQAGKPAVATVNSALQQGHSTLEGMTSAALNPIAASLYTSRLLDLPFPDKSQRSTLEEYSFLLSRQERLGSAGKAAIVQRQDSQAQGVANSDDLEKGREFHQILSGYGDHPNLLRALGLVVDFSIAAPTAAQLGAVGGQARQFFAIAGGLTGNPAQDTTNATVTSILKQKAEPDAISHDGSTVCLFRERVINRTTHKILTIAPSPDSDLDNDGFFFRKERFATLQWDLVALLRAAIREKDYVVPGPAASTVADSPFTAKSTVAADGTPIPTRPPAIDLVSHGITIIRAPGGKTMADTVSAALQQQRPTGFPNFQKSWSADELTRGYLVEVRRCREDLNTGGSSWSQWKPLTSRHVKYLLQTDANAALEALSKKHPLGQLSPAQFLFEADDIAPIGLGVTEGLQPLSGWVLGPVKPDGQNDLSIPLGPLEKNALGLSDIPDPILARCFLLATHTGIIAFADVPNVDEFAQWQQKPPGTPMPIGPLEAILRQSSSSGKQFLFGAYVDLEGIIAQDVSPGGLFLAKRVRLLSADQGAGSAGTIVGTPVIRGLDQTATPEKPAFAEAVLRIQRRTELALSSAPGQPPLWTHTSGINTATFIHLRRLFTQRTDGAVTDADPNNPLQNYNAWLTKLPAALLNAGAPIPGALFLQGQGELALAVNSRDRIHVVNFVQAAATPGGGEQGELRLQYRGPGDNGRSLFNLADTPPGTLGTQFLPVSLALNGVTIQTLTNAQAAPAELTPSATFVALLQRGADGAITVASLVEVAPAQSAIVTGFSGSNHLTLQLPETPDGLPVEVHPELTMVVCAEPSLPNAPAPGNSASDGITLGPDSDAGSSSASGGQFVRGPWAQQGLRVQVGDTCTVELGPAPVGSGVRFRVNRLTIAAHSRAHTLVGYFVADDDPNSPLTADDRQAETVFGFRELLPQQPPTPNPPVIPPTARQWRVAVDDQTRIVSGPGLAGQSWRFRQGPPPPGVLVKVFVNADLSVSSPNATINAAGLEILNGIDGKILGFTGNDGNTLQLDIAGFQDPLLIPLDPALTAGWQGAQDLRPLLSRNSANVRFRQDNLAGELTVDLEGTVDAGTHTFTLTEANGTRFTGAIQALPNGRVPGPDETVEMNVTWSVNGPSPSVAPIRPVRAIARLQFSQFEAASRRLEAVVVVRDGAGTALRPGTRTALYLESGETVDPLAYLQPQIAGLIASGLPLDIEVDETLVVDIPPASTNPPPTESGQPGTGNRPLHQMSLFAWPATPENVTAYEAGPPPGFAPTQLRGDKSVATLWAKREKKFFYPGSGDDSDEPVRLVAAQNADGSYRPLIPIDSLVGPAAALQTIPAIAGLPSEITAFLPDQTIFDDAVLHWFGRSAAVGLPGKPGLSQGARKLAATPPNGNPPNGHDSTPPPADQPTRIDPLTLAVTIPDRDCMPLRFGWLYAFRFRPIYLTGDAPCATSNGHESCDFELDNNQAVIFRPFATVSPLVPDNSGDVLDPLPHAPVQSNPDLLPFLRLEPLPPPRLGFPNKYQDPKIQSEQRWGDPNDVHLLTSGPTGQSCPGVFAPSVQPILEIHAPEAPFRLAELLGLLDAVYLKYRRNDKKGNKTFDPKAVAGLYKLLTDLDAHSPTEANDDPAAPPTPAPIGFVPYRLPDSDAEGLVFEIRPFGEAVAANIPASASLLVPCFGTDPCTWMDNGCSTRIVNFHITDKVRPNIPADQTWAVSGITVQVVNEELWMTLPPGMDCEITFRSRPAPGSLPHLAVTRFLEELAAQLEIPPLTPPSQAFLSDPRLTGDRTVALTAIKKNWTAAASGFHPFLSAGLTLRVRHMTARPQRPPSKVSLLMGERLPGATSALFDGQYRLDRATTGAIVIQTALEMGYEDDPKSALPRVPDCELKRILPREFPPHPSVTAGRDFYGFASDGLRAILAGEFTLSRITPINPPPIPQTGGEIEPIRYRQELSDTKHHTVFYRPLAVSRFVDFFKKEEINFNPCEGGYDRPLGDAPPAEEDARVPWDRVEIPATTRPHVPVIKDQSIVYDWVPALDASNSPWARTWEGWTFTRTRLAGVRLWLERPWYSSGSGEALAVLCWARSRVHQGEVERYLRTVSRWGTDPVFETTSGAATDMGIIVRSDFTHADPSPAELSVPSSATSQPDTAVAITTGANGSPAVTSAASNGANNSGALPFQGDPKLGLAVHRPKFHPDERLWYCDIFIRPRRYTPFAFLSVARYQPYALPECALSESVRVDTMQIHPPRTLRINLVASRESGRQLDITLTGLFPADPTEDRRLVLCQVERYTGVPPADETTSSQPLATPGIPTASLAPIIPPPNPKATTEYPDLGWVTVPLADESIAPTDIVTAQPTGTTAADHASDRVRRQLPGLPLEAKRRGRETVYHLSTPVPAEPTIPADAILRVVISEYELYPSAYPLTEGQTWAPRLVYADHATLPLQDF